MNRYAGPRSLLRNLVDSHLGQGTAQVLSFVRMLLLASLVGPEPLGAFAILMLVITYGAAIDLGALSGMTRQVPLLRAQGRAEDAKAVRDSSFTGTLTAATLAGFGLIVWAWVDPSGQDLRMRTSLATMGFALVAYELFNFHVALARLDHRFDLHRNGVILRGVVELALGVWWILDFGALGLALAFVVSNLTGALYLRWTLPERYSLGLQVAVLRRSMADGFPIFLTGLSMVAMASLDRVLLATAATVTIVGYHALGMQLGVLVLFLPTYACNVLYIRFLDHLGHGNVPGAIAGDFERANAAFSLAVPAVTGFLAAATWVIPKVLPAYADGIEFLQATMLCQAALAFGVLPAVLLAATGKAMRTVAVQGACAVAIAGLGTAAVFASIGPTGILAAVTIGYTAYSLILSHLAAKQAGAPMAFGGWLPLLIISIAMAIVAQSHHARALTPMQALATLTLTTLAVSGMQAWSLQRRTGWVSIGLRYAHGFLRGVDA